MRYAYGITAALLLGGTALTLTSAVGAQVAQNEPGTITMAVPPRPGAPMSFADLAARLQPAVVNISTEQRVPVSRSRDPMEEMMRQFGVPVQPQAAPGQTRPQQALGSGFIISADGFVVTNNHLVQGAGGVGTVDKVTVTLTDRKEYKARIVGRDPATDLALLKIDGANLPFVRFGDSTTTRVGDWVVAIGNPLGLAGTVTAGIVSSLGRNIGATQYDRFIQTDAAINLGNSGGPMFDLNGNVIGINTALFSRSSTGGNIGIGFAIPAEQARPIIAQLQRGQRVQRGYLGLGPQQLDDQLADSFGLPRNRGELVGSVQPGEAAARAGIQQGDVIVRINNRDVTPDETLSYIVSNQPVGSRIPIDLIRNGQRRTVTATVGQRPTDEQLAQRSGGNGGLPEGDSSVPQTGSAAASTRQSIGLAVVPLTAQIAQQFQVPPSVRGVVIAMVEPSSDAAQRGLQRGDVILSINGRPTLTATDAAAAVAESKQAGRRAVRLFVQTGAGPARYVGLELLEG